MKTITKARSSSSALDREGPEGRRGGGWGELYLKCGVVLLLLLHAGLGLPKLQTIRAHGAETEGAWQRGRDGDDRERDQEGEGKRENEVTEGRRVRGRGRRREDG